MIEPRLPCTEHRTRFRASVEFGISRKSLKFVKIMGQPFQMTREVLSYNILCVCVSPYSSGILLKLLFVAFMEITNMIVKTTTDAFHLFYSVTDPPAISKRIVVFLHPTLPFSCAIASESWL